ncbi:hypothetical protein L211DRAFT_48033 [Terfezia boudieri ATCC MYA-4762]|uniref:Gfo/Idh/MocA-like oxidoreductase N-terminal domain-containing protein n=1 Tax=Terfezia boudieri ATCC MYA-4762 TaxID=1051890 RepID=A0A3N4MQX1_9PEZI|nr:hypothetical protein L211DRAFT_48033 [Terfezia boudieri ATCC MYA-4762]
MAPLGIAILGSGIFAVEQHKPGVGRLRSAETCCGVLSTDFGRFASQKDVDAVIIALPIPVQPSIIKRCLLAGKHALSDKSIAPGLKQVQELLDWFMEAYKYEREVVEKMGRMLAFSVFAGNYETEWRKVPSYQGGFFLDGGVLQTAALSPY